MLKFNYRTHFFSKVSFWLSVSKSQSTALYLRTTIQENHRSWSFHRNLDCPKRQIFDFNLGASQSLNFFSLTHGWNLPSTYRLIIFFCRTAFDSKLPHLCTGNKFFMIRGKCWKLPLLLLFCRKLISKVSKALAFNSSNKVWIEKFLCCRNFWENHFFFVRSVIPARLLLKMSQFDWATRY